MFTYLFFLLKLVIDIYHLSGSVPRFLFIINEWSFTMVKPKTPPQVLYSDNLTCTDFTRGDIRFQVFGKKRYLGCYESHHSQT